MKMLWMGCVVAGLLALGGCASDTGPGDIPWNVPEPGSGGGMLGGMMSR